MSIFDIFKKENGNSEARIPYSLATVVTPYKLHANVKSSVNLSIKVKNLTKDALLTSVDIELPIALSFDEMGMVKNKSFRLGPIDAGKEKEFSTSVMGGLKTDKGEYTISLTATAHYLDYDHIINAVTKSHSLGVI